MGALLVLSMAIAVIPLHAWPRWVSRPPRRLVSRCVGSAGAQATSHRRSVELAVLGSRALARRACHARTRPVSATCIAASLCPWSAVCFHRGKVSSLLLFLRPQQARSH